MEGNFVISRQGPDLLVLRYRMNARLYVGIGCGGMGVALLGGVFSEIPHASVSFAHAVSRGVIGVLGSLLALFGLHALLNDKRIRVDCQRQRLDIEGRLLGLWVSRQTIPFAEITGVRVVNRLDQYAQPYWQLEVVPRQGIGRVLDASADAAYIERVAHAMEETIGVPIARTTFSVEAATQRPRAAR